MKNKHLIVAVVLVLLMQTSCYAEEGYVKQTYRYRVPSASNPLRGLVPYDDLKEIDFPHSMEFFYVPLSKVVVDKGLYDWSFLEGRLSEISDRGHHSIFRFYLEYPGGESGIPKYLLKAGLKVYKNFKFGKNTTPDYTSDALQTCLVDFIHAFGEKYDGDKRIGFITAGILGKWGEWHNYPEEHLSASKVLQSKVLDAYMRAFQKTHVMLRYPAAKHDEFLEENASRPFGYHDDSFALGTLSDGSEQQSWHYMAKISESGAIARDKWKHHPIGGEISPDVWGVVYDQTLTNSVVQNIETCIQMTHVSWLMDSGSFERKFWSESRHQRALKITEQLGYNFHIISSQWRLGEQQLDLKLWVENRGVAPFYYPWTVELALIEGQQLKKVYATPFEIMKVFPKQDPTKWQVKLDIEPTELRNTILAIRIASPLAQGGSAEFSNQEQNENLKGWLNLVTFE